MTTSNTVGASSTKPSTWHSIHWSKAKAHVFRLQTRIAKAEREGRRGKVKALQRLLTNSFYGRCTAIKRVTSSTGGRTPGVDGVVLRTPNQKMNAIFELKIRGYKPLPLRRIYIPKKSGKLRPLSIPTIKDRGMQALWHAALTPIAEERADPNAYGFRPKRSTHDAIEQCFKTLARRNSARWVFEGDIRACFDQISHEWLLDNVPMNKIVLRKFLKAGFMEDGKHHATELGTPQGGIISPTLAVIALSGLETKLVSTRKRQRDKEKIHMITYADDFIVTAASEEYLKDKVIPTLTASLKEVGLELSTEKSRITKIEDGFNFLGFNVRKYPCEKLLIKPSKASIKSFLEDVRALIKSAAALPTEILIHQLNPKITGWTNYYKGGVSSRAFAKIDYEIYSALENWCLKRHARKGKRWIFRKYFTTLAGDNWRFHCIVKDKDGNKKPLYLKRATDTHIRRHIKVKAEANPFNPRFKDYFLERGKKMKKAKLPSVATTAGLAPISLMRA
jgi:RNA-directed DNA polymerase